MKKNNLRIFAGFFYCLVTEVLLVSHMASYLYCHLLLLHNSSSFKSLSVYRLWLILFCLKSPLLIENQSLYLSHGGILNLILILNFFFLLYYSSSLSISIFLKFRIIPYRNILGVFSALSQSSQ